MQSGFYRFERSPVLLRHHDPSGVVHSLHLNRDRMRPVRLPQVLYKPVYALPGEPMGGRHFQRVGIFEREVAQESSPTDEVTLLGGLGEARAGPAVKRIVRAERT